MTPTCVTKNGVRYRYYVSSVLFQGQQGKAGKVKRIPAVGIETLIADGIRKRLKINTVAASEAKPRVPSDSELMSAHVARVDVTQDQLKVTLAANRRPTNGSLPNADNDQPPSQLVRRKLAGSNDRTDSNTIFIPWTKAPWRRPREIMQPGSTKTFRDPRPIRAETRTKLVSAIAKGRRWLDELVSGAVTNIDQIAARE